MCNGYLDHRAGAVVILMIHTTSYTVFWDMIVHSWCFYGYFNLSWCCLLWRIWTTSGDAYGVYGLGLVLFYGMYGSHQVVLLWLLGPQLALRSFVLYVPYHTLLNGIFGSQLVLSIGDYGPHLVMLLASMVRSGAML